MLLSFVD